ncbi:cell wall-binding repeat-containing protein [Mobiluncus curtisii]|uniref:Gram-positive signal peptide protein, YSIRK family n=1 Tax=Mobiluncus curtisii ATCC 51333 TaxID=887326 RepID=E6LXR1_9ACTO|nr:cell wall-binding repeat-containing protein [Mobiluncus curtisii]EFU80428.1 Gram-positive signal peptide protein, YSIRK family [Mobiluncus curtisii ATCC 51333]
MNLKKKFVIGAASLALVAGMGVAPAMAADSGAPIPLPGGAKLERVDGMERMMTAFNAAKLRMQASQNGTALRKAYLVNQSSIVDAATAGMVNDGVILLVPGDAKGQQLLGAMMAKDPDLKVITTLIAVGGESVMPKDAVANVAKMNSKIVSKSKRLGGKNRYETNVAIAKEFFKDGPGTLPFLLARGDNPVDAITAGAYDRGPTLLVNPSGTVDPATVEYVKSTKDNNVIAMGGEGVLPSSQISQLFDTKEQLDPWSYKESLDKLKNNLRLAAANFIGQSAWQQGEDSIAGYFGRHSENSNKGACVDTAKLSGDTTLINIKDGIPTTEKCFIGYDRSLGLMKVNAANILKLVSGKQDLLDGEVKAAKAANIADQAAGKTVKDYTANAVTFTPATPGATPSYPGYNQLAAKFKAMYGVDPTPATATIDAEGVIHINDNGSWKFSTDGAFEGVSAEAIAATVSDYKDAVGDNPAIKIGTAVKGVKLADLPSSTVNTSDALTDSTTKHPINYAAVKEVTEKALADLTAAHKDAKKALDEAIAAWKAAPAAKIFTQDKAGFPRIQGKDRYGTSALLSYFLRGASSNTYLTGWTENDGWGFGASEAWKYVFLASGEDAHLIDSVVSGQLQHGPILLVHSSGDLPADVASELKDMGTAKKLEGGYVVGGTGAVEDAVAKAAAAKIAEGGKFVTAATPAAPAATQSTKPVLGAPSGDITAAGGTATIAITGYNSAYTYNVTLDATSIAAGYTQTRNNGTITVTAPASLTSGAHATVTVSVTSDEDGAGSAKTVSEVATATINVAVS